MLHAAGQLSLCATTTEDRIPRAPAPRKKPPPCEDLTPQPERARAKVTKAQHSPKICPERKQLAELTAHTTAHALFLKMTATLQVEAEVLPGHVPFHAERRKT